MELEIKKLRAAIADADATGARERAEADTLVKNMREAGADLTADENFTKVDEAYKRADAAKDEVVALRGKLSRVLELAGQAPSTTKTEDRERQVAIMDMTERLRASDPFQGVLRSRVLETSARVHMDPVEVRDRDAFVEDIRTRTTFSNASNVGSGLLTPDYTGKMLEQFTRKVRLLDLITMGSTDTDVVDWVVEQARTDAAAETAYGTAVPESAYGFAHAQTNVKRVGHHVPATKGILMDAGQTRSLLDARLINGLYRRLELQMYSGNGTGENLEGFSGLGIGTQAVGSDTILDAVHKAITNIRVNSLDEIEPTVILIHPTDHEKIVLAKSSTGQYLNANPSAGGAPTTWGLLPVVTTLVSAGTPYVGDFKDACMAWMRTGVSVSATDTHSDWFLKGLIAIMAECRLAFKTVRPTSICSITGF